MAKKKTNPGAKNTKALKISTKIQENTKVQNIKPVNVLDYDAYHGFVIKVDYFNKSPIAQVILTILSGEITTTIPLDITDVSELFDAMHNALELCNNE